MYTKLIVSTLDGYLGHFSLFNYCKECHYKNPSTSLLVNICLHACRIYEYLIYIHLYVHTHVYGFARSKMYIC